MTTKQHVLVDIAFKESSFQSAAPRIVAQVEQAKTITAV